MMVLSFNQQRKKFCQRFPKRLHIRLVIRVPRNDLDLPRKKGKKCVQILPRFIGRAYQDLTHPWFLLWSATV